MIQKLRLIAIFAIVLTVSTLTANNALAKNESNVRPGWGFGDNNHIHIGPPGGPSVHPIHEEFEEFRQSMILEFLKMRLHFLALQLNFWD